MFDTFSWKLLCLCIVIIGSSRDIGNGNRVQIIRLKRNGIYNNVIAAQLSWNGKTVQTIGEKWKKTLAWSSEADVTSWRQTSEDDVKVGTFEDYMYLGVILWLDHVFWHAVVIKKLWDDGSIHVGNIFSLVARKKLRVHRKTANTTLGGPRVFSTGAPKVNCPMLCFLMSVRFFQTNDGREKCWRKLVRAWILTQCDFGYVETCLLRFENAWASMALTMW